MYFIIYGDHVEDIYLVLACL